MNHLFLLVRYFHIDELQPDFDVAHGKTGHDACDDRFGG
jgi:hypothetical protein